MPEGHQRTCTQRGHAHVAGRQPLGERDHALAQLPCRSSFRCSSSTLAVSSRFSLSSRTFCGLARSAASSGSRSAIASRAAAPAATASPASRGRAILWLQRPGEIALPERTRVFLHHRPQTLLRLRGQCHRASRSSDIIRPAGAAPIRRLRRYTRFSGSSDARARGQVELFASTRRMPRACRPSSAAAIPCRRGSPPAGRCAGHRSAPPRRAAGAARAPR